MAEKTDSEKISDSLSQMSPEVRERVGATFERRLKGKELQHTVSKGETLSRIANRYGVSLPELAKANPQIEDLDKIEVGDKVTLPRKASDSFKERAPVKERVASSLGRAAAGRKQQHTVKSGDTLSALAKKYGTTVSALMRFNPQIEDKNKIKVGQKITLPLTAKGNKPPKIPISMVMGPARMKGKKASKSRKQAIKNATAMRKGGKY